MIRRPGAHPFVSQPAAALVPAESVASRMRGSRSQPVAPAVKVAWLLVVTMLALAATSCGQAEEVPKIVLGPDSPNGASDADISPQATDGTDLSGLTFDLFAGGSGAISDYAGTPLVVNFFASWCPPCVREMSDFQEVFESLEGVAFLGLSQDQSPTDALDLVEATGVTYDVGWDLDLEVYEATGSIAMPTTAFVSPTGELLDTWAGVLDSDSLAERIETTLGAATRP